MNETNEPDDEESGRGETDLNITLANMQKQINQLKLSNARLQLQRESDLNGTLLENRRCDSPHVRDVRKGRRVSDWGVTFDGERKSDLLEFFERISKLQHTEKTNDRDLFDQALYLFTGKAKNWFNAFGHKFRSWHELKEELKRVHIRKDHNRVIRKKSKVVCRSLVKHGLIISPTWSSNSKN